MVGPTLIAALLSIFALIGCDKAHDSSTTPQTTTSSQEQPKAPEQDEQLKAALREAGDGKLKVRQAIFLNRLKKQSPDNPTIERALITDNNELGLIFNSNVAEDQIPDLTKSVVEKMAQEFPDDNLVVVAFTQSDPPRKLGRATRDATTKEIAYKPETN